jgi:shikimate 5-dehydrogenase
MLIEQGALAFELWTNKTAPRKLMREAAEKKLRGE